MTRYYALVLVEEDVHEDERVRRSFRLLSPFILTIRRSRGCRFDYPLDPRTSPPDEDHSNVWRAGEIADKLGNFR